MMTTNFVSVIVLRTDERRFVAEPFDPVQQRYLQILGLSEAVFTNPSVKVIQDAGAQTQRPRVTR